MERPFEVEPVVEQYFYRRNTRCLCGATSAIGVLCRACALEVEPCDGLIPDHIHSRIDPRDAGAWVVDGFGGAHAIAATTAIGRNYECELVVLAGSVSRDHAELRRALCIRACEEAASPSPIRGCVPTKRLARELPFQSRYANQENVRQVVLRLRGVLADVGAHGVLAVAPGRGYYLAADVTLASHDTRLLPRIADRRHAVRPE